MKLRELVVKNFRNLVDIRIPVDDTTVLCRRKQCWKDSLDRRFAGRTSANRFRQNESVR